MEPDMKASPMPNPGPYKDRRRAPRLENRGRLLLQLVSDDAPVKMHDFSTGGFSLVSPTPFVPGKVHKFRIGPRGGPFALLSARVAYSRRLSRHQQGDEYLIGLAFEKLDAASRKSVDRLLDALTGTLSFE
jgi:hypothetical protein